jgi:hypothetical protein
MNSASLRRKIFYVLAIVALLIPLFVLGQPSVQRSSVSGKAGSPGGKLAQLRDRYDFGQSSLGKLDPASETMRLASLGLRGLAATILWNRADYFKEEKYWDKLSATLNQLSLLQPHFVSVWDQQAHNLSYNVSAEFDDYRQRYLWVKKGIDHLARGVEFNRRQPMMQYTLGKYTTHKFGRSDEKTQFRQLFRNDEPFHQRLTEYGLDLQQPESRGSDQKPDNWLVGRLWFHKAYQLYESGAPIKKSQWILYNESPLALMYYAEAIESEGVLDDRAIFAWSRAHDAWKDYGDMDLQTTWNHTIKMRGYSAAKAAADEAQQIFDDFTNSVRQQILEENKGKFSVDENAAIQKKAADRSPDESSLAESALQRVMPQPNIIAQRMPRELRAKATELANNLTEKKTFASHTERYREHCNYGYWETLSELEQTRTAVAARRQIYDAEEFLMKGDLDKAIPSFEAGWKNWDKILRKYPMIIHDEVCDRLLKSINRYANAATEGTLADDFPLNWFYRYRAIRDKNKGGAETLKMYDSFSINSIAYDANLDMPFEIETATTVPEAAQGDLSGKSPSGEDATLKRDVPRSPDKSVDALKENAIENDSLKNAAGTSETNRTPPPLEAPL